MCPVMCIHILAVALEQNVFKEVSKSMGEAAALASDGLGVMTCHMFPVGYWASDLISEFHFFHFLRRDNFT